MGCNTDNSAAGCIAYSYAQIVPEVQPLASLVCLVSGHGILFLCHQDLCYSCVSSRASDEASLDASSFGVSFP